MPTPLPPQTQAIGRERLARPTRSPGGLSVLLCLHLAQFPCVLALHFLSLSFLLLPVNTYLFFFSSYHVFAHTRCLVGSRIKEKLFLKPRWTCT